MANVGPMLILSASLACGIQTVQAQESRTQQDRSSNTKSALDSIRSEDLLKHINILASDEFEGRAPGTRGEELTVNYLIDQCRRLGLKPGHPDGTYIQNVPMVGFTPLPAFSYRAGGQTTEVSFPADCVVWSPWFVPEVNVPDSEMIFVGYGVVAPEYGWDDFKGVDVRGKTIVMLVNDPAIPDPKAPAKLDDAMFKGRAMTYYGRWTYKYEIAAAKGAAAAIIVHETGPAGYPYFVLVSSNSRENFDLQSPNQNRDRASVEGWITLDQAKKLFAASGHDFDALKRQAIRRDFRPVPLATKATFQIRTSMRDVASRNVVAVIEGSDPKLKHEYIVYTAHWDHLGRNPKLEGDQIFNGALDNASGTAGLLELAEAFTKLKPAPKRSILFLFVTAEEKGLLGAKFYAKRPLYPLAKTLANLNIDGVNVWGRTRDINVVGYGGTTLEDLLQDFAKAQGRAVAPDSEPEKGRYYRSDHFEFAKLGVPGLYLKSGIDFVGKPAGFGRQKSDEYTARDYHKVSDEVKEDWDLAGAAEDLQLLFQVGYRVAQGDKYPEWKAGSEFIARREEMLRGVEGLKR
ncbi:MAG: M20/M25/M40 family metallo-hydrolase [Verrucomicrobia bacterium]|nr:M20/M25/M40 family metallo-hydrolase [Verrucomicrobiota bacterium]